MLYRYVCNNLCHHNFFPFSIVKVGEIIAKNCIDSAEVEGDDTTDDIVVPEENGSTCGTITDPEDSSIITFCLCAWDNCNKDFETAETTTTTTATTTK